MKKISWLFLFLGIVILSASACSLKKDEVKQEVANQKENVIDEKIISKQETISDRLSKTKEICGAEPTKVSTIKVGDYYKTHKIKEISGNLLEKNCENSCSEFPDGLGLKVLFDGEETVSGTLFFTDYAFRMAFIPDDKTWTPYILVNNEADNYVLSGISCMDSFSIENDIDDSVISKLPDVKNFLANAKDYEKYPKKVSVTIKNLRTSFLSGADGGTIAELVDIKLLNNQNDSKTYSNKDLGISFNYPSKWPEPVFIKNAVLTGSMFDADGQWEIELGDLHKNSLEGADKYFASVRGVYKQSRSDILKKIKADEKEGSARLIKETDSYIVYNEVGIVGVKNIMIFGKSKTIRIQSLGDTLDSEIDSIADSLRFN